MKITRTDAFCRLLSRWLLELERDAQTPLRFPLDQLLTESNIEAVQSLDLYPDLRVSPRDQMLVQTWMCERSPAGVQ